MTKQIYCAIKLLTSFVSGGEYSTTLFDALNECDLYMRIEPEAEMNHPDLIRQHHQAVSIRA